LYKRKVNRGKEISLYKEKNVQVEKNNEKIRKRKSVVNKIGAKNLVSTKKRFRHFYKEKKFEGTTLKSFEKKDADFSRKVGGIAETPKSAPKG
jgi:hypothetical protein